MAAWVLSAFQDRSASVMLTLYMSIVRSNLEYCCPVWNPTYIGEIQKLENVQRSFIRKILGCKDLTYWDRLKKLHLMSLRSLVVQFVAEFFYASNCDFQELKYQADFQTYR